MRISKIEIRDFRVFYDNHSIDLQGGKNLLILGENGSGKTSLYQALNLFLQSGLEKQDFKQYRNIFVARDDGYVKLTLHADNDPDSGVYEWSETASPHGKSIIIEAAKSSGFVDYKGLLETHYIHRRRGKVNIFELLVEVLLKNTENPITKRPIGEEWRQLQDYIKMRFYPGTKRAFETLLNKFNDGLSAVLHELKAKAGEVLPSFEPRVTIDLIPQAVTYSRSPRKKLNDPTVDLTATYFGRAVDGHHLFLNEGRLSAIALSVYFASLLINPLGKLKVLVLDDVLIGLDMANRIPVLDILKKYFSDWQIILMTHDLQWFQIAGRRLNGWEKVKLFVRTDGVKELPHISQDIPYLDKAMEYYKDGDLKAAGVYLRSAFEEILQRACANLDVSVKFHKHPTGHNTDEFWRPLQKSKELSLSPGLIGDIEICRKHILNPLAHFTADPMHSQEIVQTHSILTRLKEKLDEAIRLKKNVAGTRKKQIEIAYESCYAAASDFDPWKAACDAHEAFDQSLREFCKRREIKFPYSDTLAEHNTGNLWREAKVVLQSLGGDAVQFVAEIDQQRDIFYVPLVRDKLAALTQTELQKAISTLVDPSSIGGEKRAKFVIWR